MLPLVSQMVVQMVVRTGGRPIDTLFPNEGQSTYAYDAAQELTEGVESTALMPLDMGNAVVSHLERLYRELLDAKDREIETQRELIEELRARRRWRFWSR